jgi:hypothetical protein
MFDFSKWVKSASIILLATLWFGLRVGYKDNYDDWNPPITLENITTMWIMM